MNILRRQMMVLAVRAYAVAALISVILMSPPLLSGIPILLTAAYIFMLWRGTHTATSLLMNYFVFFAIGLLLTQVLSPLLSTALALPLLVSVTVDLQTYALSAMLQPSVHKRGP